MRKILSFLWQEYPRISRNPKLLMYAVYFWKERLTPTGHCLAILMFFTLFFIWIPGAFAFKVFLVFCSSLLFVALFTRFPPKNITVTNVQIHAVTEGEKAKISATVLNSGKRKQTLPVHLGAFRMHPALHFRNVQETYQVVKSGEAFAENSAAFYAEIQTSRRGVFPITVAAVVPDALGISTILRPAAGNYELYVLPRPLRVSEFRFLTFGKSGRAFAPFFNPSLTRGLDFIGVREYREGDSLRDLHHKAFARYGKPFTKEFAAERGNGLILLLDVSCTKILDKTRVENAVRLCAGIALWLLERNLLGRFFIGDQEIEFTKSNAFKIIRESLARAPYPELRQHFPQPKTWAPTARPMAPVLSVSVLPLDSPLITKQIVVSEKAEQTDELLQIVLNNEREVRL